MSRPKSTPSYCLHKPSGRAYVTIDGRQRWLGVHESAESRAEYDRIIGEWLVNGRRGPEASGRGVTVSRVLAAFLAHAEAYYVEHATAPDGTPLIADDRPVMKPSRECENYKAAMKPVRRLYGATPAVAFGPKALKVVREDMINRGICRNVVNRRVARVKQVFKWATSARLIPPSVYQALATVAGLRAGRSKARESKPVRPVLQEHIDAVLPYLPSPVAAIVKLQRLTGMRGGELFIMRTRDIDTSGPTWHYRPSSHKTAHHGHDREVPIGPQAREVLEPLLRPDLSAFLFSPADAIAEMRAKRAAKRDTPTHRGNAPGTNRKAKPKRRPRLRYDRNAYRLAIVRACEKAFGMPSALREPLSEAARAMDTPEAKAARRTARKAWRAAHVWHPHQLRHTFATAIRREHGLDAARMLLGHKTAAITQEYAERDKAQADQIAAKIG